MDWVLIIPPLLTAVFTYIVAAQRAKIKQAQVMAEIQSNAIKVVAEIEDRLRKELKSDLEIEKKELERKYDDLKKENDVLRNQVSDFQGQLSASDHLIKALKDEILALKSTIDLYRSEMARNKKRLADLENGHNESTE